jgi:puromycin-sensitive aminopeptidase
VWLDFDQGKAAALQLDALRSTHPIHSEVKNADEATESFDLITYEKGGAVLRMIEGWLGAEPFRDGMRLYMRRHGKANAVADDLWRALGEASRQPVLELANAWIGQGGFPLVEATRDGTRLRLSQRRFFSDPASMEAGGGAEGPLWPVPMVIRYEDGRGVREERHLLRGRQEEVTLAVEGEPAWVSANAGATGFYRVAWDPASVAALVRHVAKLAPSERIALLADEWALVRAGLRDVGAFLDLCAGLGGEEDYAVLDELGGRLAAIEHKLVAEADRPRLEAFVARLLGPQLERLGWDPAQGEPDPVRLRRASLVRALGLTARQPAVAAEAARRLDRFLAGEKPALEPNLHDAAVVLAARAGDARRFDQLRALYASETDPAFKRRYLLALAAFEDPALSRRARELALSDEVPLQDFSSFVAALLGNRQAREPFWQTMRAEWPRFEARVGGAPMLLRRIVEAVGLLPERRHLQEAEALFEAHPLEAARQGIAQTLERMKLDADLRDRALPAVGRWLAAS